MRTKAVVVAIGLVAILFAVFVLNQNLHAHAGVAVVGTWRDVTLDKLKSLSADDKKMMQAYITFGTDGSGTFITGGFRKASRLNRDLHWTSHTVPFKWTFKAGIVSCSQDGKYFFRYELSSDGRTLTSTDGNNVRYERFKGPVPKPVQAAV